MFGNNKPKETGKAGPVLPAATTHALNSIVQGTSVEGDIRSVSDIRIDGSIKGSLVCEAKLIIGPSGSVEGEVKCKNAVVEGKFEGDLTVTELLTLKESARVNGKIRYHKLVVQPGAALVGDVRLGDAKSSEPPVKTVSSGQAPVQ